MFTALHGAGPIDPARYIAATANGKVDTAALPLNDDASTDPEPMIAPVTSTEQVLHAIWCELLSQEQISCEHDFFEAGGHSLLAIRVIARVRERLGVELAIREVFAHPTIVSFAARVNAVRPAVTLPYPAIPRSATFALSGQQQREWLAQMADGRPRAHRFELALGAVDAVQSMLALRTLLQRHEALRVHAALRSDQPVMLLNASPRTAMLVIDLQGLHVGARESAQASITRQLRTAEPLASDPTQLLATLLRLQPARDQLHVSVSAFAADPSAAALLRSDLAQLLTADRRAPLAPAIDAMDYLHWQARADAGAASLAAAQQLSLSGLLQPATLVRRRGWADLRTHHCLLTGSVLDSRACAGSTFRV